MTARERVFNKSPATSRAVPDKESPVDGTRPGYRSVMGEEEAAVVATAEPEPKPEPEPKETQ